MKTTFSLFNCIYLGHYQLKNPNKHNPVSGTDLKICRSVSRSDLQGTVTSQIPTRVESSHLPVSSSTQRNMVLHLLCLGSRWHKAATRLLKGAHARGEWVEFLTPPPTHAVMSRAVNMMKAALIFSLTHY